jgi:hypothetical protein
MPKITIYSWNTWGIPFANPKALTQPAQCADELSKILINEGKENKEDLIVICLQECWSWRAGVGYFFIFLARLLEPLFGRLCTFPLLSLSLLLSLVIPIPRFLVYNTTRYFVKALQEIFPHNTSTRVRTLSFWRLLDSGLLTFSSKPIISCGFQPYKSSGGEDIFANKGFIWALV